jgi:hypothetical protein
MLVFGFLFSLNLSIFNVSAFFVYSVYFIFSVKRTYICAKGSVF